MKIVLALILAYIFVGFMVGAWGAFVKRQPGTEWLLWSDVISGAIYWPYFFYVAFFE